MSLKKRIGRFFAYHLIALAVLIFIALVYKCPVYYLFHFPCPGCGVTRSYKALLSLDFAKAFEYNPMFWTAAPIILYTAHRKVLPRKLSSKAETIILFTVCGAFVSTYLIRLITGNLSVLV